MGDFLRLVDTAGRCHLVARAEFVRVAPTQRPDGRSFSPGALVYLRGGATIAIYEPERAALEEALLAQQQEGGGGDG